MKKMLLVGLLLLVGMATAANLDTGDGTGAVSGGGTFGFESEDGDDEMELGDDNDEVENETEEPELYGDELEDETDDYGFGEQEREREREQERIQEGIAAQVHTIIQERKGGTLDVPQGQIVRIVAQNREIYVGNESIPLNATLRVRLRIQDQEHVLAFNSSEDDDEIEIEENGTRVKTRETLRLTNQEMLAGENQTGVLVTPAQIKDRTRLKNLERIQLHVENGNPYYEVNGTKPGKFLGLFDVELPIQARIHAQTGVVEKEQGPWWAFLVATE